MFNPNEKKAHQTLKIFNFAWLIFTLILIFVGIGIERHHFRLEDKATLEKTTDQLTDKLENTIERIEQSVYQLELTQSTLQSCQADLKNRLDKLLFNYPTVSGIFITDTSNQLLCSTLNFDPKILTLLDKKKALIGPITLSNKDNPAYILQLRDGNYGVNLFILKNVFENLLLTQEPLISSITLVTRDSNQVILQLNTTPSKPPSAITAVSGNNLRNIPNTRLIIKADNQNVHQKLYIYETTGTILAILFSVFGYLRMKSMLSKLHSDEKYLQYALKQRKFFPVYLPTFSLKANKFVGSEVLIRLKTDTENIVMPNFFIPQLEKSGLIVPVTVQLIDTALEECKPLLEDPTQHLAFNLSASHFIHDNFILDVIALLKKHQVPAKQIIFEITEREILDIDDERFLVAMKKLRALGCSLAIDDFGTGHASIKYLQHFPFTHLKIDQTFVQSIGTGAVTESLNNSIILLAKELKLKIIAEGVETAEQFNFLKQHHVDYYQGWYFSKAKAFDKLKN